jgi:hypothetical protein
MRVFNIVYVSRYGFTKRYAEMAAQKFGVKAYSFKEAKKELSKGEPIIFMAGINNNRLNEIKKVSKRFDIKSVCAVGMSFYRETLPELIRIINGFDEGFPLYYAQGGLDPNKITKVERFFIQMALGAYNNVMNPTAEDYKTVDMLGNAGDYVSEDKLYPFYAYVLDDPSYLELMPKEEIVVDAEVIETENEDVSEEDPE